MTRQRSIDQNYCKRGHRMDDANTYKHRTKKGTLYVICKVCRRESTVYRRKEVLSVHRTKSVPGMKPTFANWTLSAEERKSLREVLAKVDRGEPIYKGF